ncbi:MAG: TetR family transcriptional regulator [Actinobacteria bacterium]|nr:TetR family transcriptional regulator [Actinomycetota bacterium]
MTPAPRRGRRPGDPGETRRAILDAARDEFAASAYDGATIRAIAERAGVDPALVHHHFGTKEELFVAAHDVEAIPASVAAAMAAGRGTPGERLARAYLGAMEANPNVEGLLRSAATNEHARALLRDFMQRTVFDAYQDRIGGEDARLRMGLAAAQMLGVLFLRRFVGLDALAHADLEDIVERVAPVLDLHLGDVRLG